MPEYALILIRSIFSFIVLLIMTRLMGKKQISQLTFFDYVVGITIGSIAATLSIDQNIRILNGMIGILVWGLFPVLLGFLDMKSYKLRTLTDGSPTVLVQKGQILEKNLRKEKLTTQELMLLLREKQAFKLAEVEFAILETNGQLSVLKKTDAQPITAKMLGKVVEMEHETRTLIIDGVIMQKTLKDLGYSNEWLIGEIEKQGATRIEDVFYAEVDSKGNLYVDLYRDKMDPPKMMNRALVGATLNKAQADLEIYALETADKEAKQIYMEQAKKLKELIKHAEVYLKD